MEICSCFKEDVSMNGDPIYLCYGTKEIDCCSCGGDKSKCDFYPEKRAKKERLSFLDAITEIENVLKASNTSWMLSYNPKYDTYNISISEINEEDK